MIFLPFLDLSQYLPIHTFYTYSLFNYLYSHFCPYISVYSIFHTHRTEWNTYKYVNKLGSRDGWSGILCASKRRFLTLPCPLQDLFSIQGPCHSTKQRLLYEYSVCVFMCGGYLQKCCSGILIHPIDPYIPRDQSKAIRSASVILIFTCISSQYVHRQSQGRTTIMYIRFFVVLLS